MRMLKKITAVILVISMVLTLQGGVFIQLTNDVVKAIDDATLDLPFYVLQENENSEKSNKHVKRLIEDENEYTNIFANDDGTITVYSYTAPVKYKDSKGNFIDYDPRLKEVKNQDKKSLGYAYEITSSDVSVMVPEDLASNKYITVEKDKYKIDFKPIYLKDSNKTADDSAEATIDSKYKAIKIKTDDGKHQKGVEYVSADSDDIIYKYYTLDTGIKEDVILNKAPQSNILQYEMKIKGAIPILDESGGIEFVDEKTNEHVGYMSPFFMYDSHVASGNNEEEELDGPHMAMDLKTELVQVKNNENKYILTVYLDEEMLNSAETVYPITVDPEINLDSGSEMYDAYVVSGSSADNNYNPTNWNYFNKTSSGRRRSFVKPVIPLSYYPYEIVSATYKTWQNYDGTYTRYGDINAVTADWDPATLTWNNQPGYGDLIDRQTVVAKKWYTYDVKDLFDNWALFEMSGGAEGYENFGFIIKEKSELYYNLRAFSSGVNPWYKPLIKVVYNQDSLAPNNITSLTTTQGEDPVNNGKATLTFEWPETTDNPVGDNEGVKEYELTVTDSSGNFYNADGTMTAAATPESYTPEIINHIGTIEIIVDNDDAEFSTVGTWPTSTSSSGYYGTNYQHDGSEAASPGTSATWTPNIQTAGNYKVYMMWTAYSNRPDAAPVEIQYNGGTDTSITVDQTQNGSEWVLLGTYNLSEGTGNYVKIKGDDAGATIADAVKFVYQDTYIYSKEFINLPDNTTYEAKIRACDNAPLINNQWYGPNWSGYTYANSEVVGDIEEVSIASITPNDWTDDLTPTITWTGIDDTMEVQYCLDGGAWTNTGLLGSAGSGDLPSLGFTQDGQYQLKIRGMDTTTSTPSPESWEVTYKYDSTLPTVNISSPSDGGIIGESVDILGSVLDATSGIASWTLEQNDGTEPITWEEIATGTEAVPQGQLIAAWDTSTKGPGNYTVRLTAIDGAGHSSLVEEIALSKPVSYTLTAPTNLTATANTNYMMTVDWEDGINPSGTTYSVYRGTVDTFVPDSDPQTGNMVAEGLSDTYWYDFDVSMSTTYYYKVIASYDVGAGMFELSNPSAASNQGTVTKSSEITEKLGLQNYWKFSSFAAGNGTGYINVANGNLVFNSVDSVYPGYMLAMVMRRTYNSQSDVKTSLGYGWDFSYNTRLYKEYDSANDEWDIILKDGDGSLHYFGYNAPVGGVATYTTPNGVFMELKYYEATDEYVIVRNDYVTYTFNGNLQIVKLAELNGNYLKFNYNLSGKLESVQNCNSSDSIINQADFSYYLSTDTGVDAAHVGLLKEMTDEAGRTYRYEYEAGIEHLKKVYMTTAVSGEYYSEEYTYKTGTHNLETVKDATGHVTTISYDGYYRVTNVLYPDPDTSVSGDRKSFVLDYSVANTTKITGKWGTADWGGSTTYEYNANGSVTDITNAVGDKTTYTYNGYYQVTSVSYENYVEDGTSPTLITTTIDYDDNDFEGDGVSEGTTGKILSIKNPYNNVTSFTYDTVFEYKVTSVTIPINASTDAVTTNVYNSTTGNLEKTIDAEGNETVYTYYGSGLIETVTNIIVDGTSRFGTKTYYTYDGEGRLDEVRMGPKDTANASLTLMSKVISYDSYGNPTVVQDVNGIQSKVEYDALGRPTKTYLPDMDGTETTQDWTNNEYTTAVFDIKGVVQSTTDIKGITTSIDYDGMGRIKSTTTNVSPTITNSVSYSTHTYNNKTCLKVTSTNAEGTKTIEYYDELGRVYKTAVWDADETEPLLKEKTRVIYEYDSAGNVISTKDLIVEIVDSGAKVISDYREVTFEYDKLNRQKTSKTYTDDPVPVLIETSTTYDYVGNVKTQTDAKGYMTSYTYDKIGRLTQVQQYEGSNFLNTNYSFDNIVSYTNLDNVTKTLVMNTVTDAEGRVRQTYLDEYGNAVAEINHGTSTTDSTKMIVERTFNLDGTVATVNQAAPNQTDSTVRQTDYYEFNNWGLIKSVQYASETSNPVTNPVDNQTIYNYNDHGQVSTMTDRREDLLNGGVHSVTTTYQYDTLGRTLSVAQGDTISYEYNNVNQITKLTQPSSGTLGGTEVTDYEYDSLGQLKFIKHNGNTIREYDYLSTGQLNTTVDNLKFYDTNLTAANMTTKYLYTNQGQVKEIKYTNDTTSTTLEKYNYEYDLNGNIEQEIYYQSYGGSSTLTKDFEYDSINRLSRMDYEGDRAYYTYDKVGNKIKERYFNHDGSDWYDANKFTDWDYNEFDQLTQVDLTWNSPDNPTQWIGKYNYDAKGQMTSSETRAYNDVLYYTEYGTGEYDDDGWEITVLKPVYRYGGVDGANTSAMVYNTSYTFDKAGYMNMDHTEVSNDVFVDTYHYYNGMEQRIKKIVDLGNNNEEVTNYTYSGRIQLFTTSGSSVKLTENILAPNGQTIASQRFDGDYANKYYFMNTDIRNSTTAILSDSYTAKKYYSYDTFGKTEENGDSNFTNFIGFTGAVSEGDDIYYMNARFYDANTSRFLSQDTFKGNAWEPWSQNLYSYTGNNPVNFVDPTGHIAEANEGNQEEYMKRWSAYYAQKEKEARDKRSVKVRAFADAASKGLGLSSDDIYDYYLGVDRNKEDTPNWCVMYVMYFAEMYGLTEDMDVWKESSGIDMAYKIPKDDGSAVLMGEYNRHGRWKATYELSDLFNMPNRDFLPHKGDLILFNFDDKGAFGNPSHTAIVTDAYMTYDSNYLNRAWHVEIVQGNWSGGVATETFKFTSKQDIIDANIVGFCYNNWYSTP